MLLEPIIRLIMGLKIRIMHLLNKIQNVKNNFVINGKNYNTKDGTCVRDFVHIKDVVDILIKSRNILIKNKNYILNLCSGRGHLFTSCKYL